LKPEPTPGYPGAILERSEADEGFEAKAYRSFLGRAMWVVKKLRPDWGVILPHGQPK
jgi:hypothetical protein